MKFKQWFEDAMGAGDKLGPNDNDPGENGLRRMAFRKDDVPHSERADRLFLGKGRRSENKRKTQIRFSMSSK
jgi:hypothetical protein